MVFPAYDRLWVDTLNFLKEHVSREEKLVAPQDFSSKFPQRVIPYGSITAEHGNFQWVAIHKGMMADLSRAFLSQLADDFTPVFANEVFVVFSTHQELSPLEGNHPHMTTFWDELRVQRSLKYQVKTFMKTARDRLNPKAWFKRYTAPVEAFVKTSIAPPPPPVQRSHVYLGDYKALTRTVWGHKMVVDTRDISLAPHILMDGYWEMWITNFLMNEVVEEGMTIVEVGANIGYYTVLMASKIGPSGKLYSFEANPTVFDVLYQNMAVNGLLDRVTLVNKAASAKNEMLDFYTLKRYQGSSSVVQFSEKFASHYRDEVELLKVEAVALDEFLPPSHHRVDLLKMDAEGSEALIYRGMKSIISQNPQIKIVCEFAPGSIAGTGEDPRTFLESLEQLGFRFNRIDAYGKLQELTVNDLLQIPHCELFLER